MDARPRSPGAAHGARAPRTTGWAGTTLDQRRADRQERLLAAGALLMGEAGCDGVAVRAVCRSAGLTERYFYEHFADRDALIEAVYLRVRDEALEAVGRAVAASPPELELRARAVVEAFASVVLDDPLKGRILLVEALTAPVLARHGAEAVAGFAALVRSHLPDRPGPEGSARRGLAAVGMVGALSHLFVSWLSGTLDVTRSQLLAHATAVVVAHVALGG